MIQYSRRLINALDTQPFFGILFLSAFAFVYCLPALSAPFWTGNDAWSNLLPIIHYRDSILNQHSLPLFTDLWYGGRFQWQNPLWNFWYFPSTLTWLAAPLDWGTRIVYFSHFIFALLAGRKLGSIFLSGEIERVSASLILASPVFPALTAGQTEKILAWGWVLLSLYFLLNNKNGSAKRGLLAGVCLAVVPITGANYHALYTGLLVFLLALSFQDKRLVSALALGASVAVLHVPAILHLIGQPRGNAEQSILQLSMSFTGLWSSLAFGLAKPMGWETWAMISVPIVYLFLKTFLTKARQSILLKQPEAFSHLDKALLAGMTLLALLATGFLYRGHHLLDAFRIPARAISFLALTVTIFVLNALAKNGRPGRVNFLLILAALQIGLISFMIRPNGSPYGPYDAEAQELADTLIIDGAKNVWISLQDLQGMSRLNDMYIQVALTRNELGLPNVYYGDMGQEIILQGDHCGYSFDHLLSTKSVVAGPLELNPDIEWSSVRSTIPVEQLLWIGQVQVHENLYQVYRVVCDV